ncbi:hypothetical protein FHX74_003554 [Friedmanniella endophytica]|uniref:Right handed beta helix region n=1 Tax=Microlunatus kandeliicorticis TaxID=1759536 RepID=A0A7W3P7D6_9ACTN|nr:right-handed parallel beta-helix repeat-containing protein [Microlunatus kandeliicorticis]MBA8795913.1 hypothetical protein [Microlunatus kandeliicorticis]
MYHDRPRRLAVSESAPATDPLPSSGLTAVLVALVVLLATALVAALTLLPLGRAQAAPTGAAVPRPAAAGPATRTLVVAPGGDDAASGTVAHPLATVAAAVRRLPDGGTVLLRGGRYAQRFTLGHRVHDLTVRPYRHEHPVLDGSSLTPPTGRSAMITVDGSTRVTIRGLDVTGYRTTAIDAMPIGIYVHGAATSVRLAGNHVHHLGNDNRTLGSFDLNAHGIAVYGDSVAHPIRDLMITGNEVDHLKLGASESVVVNGNVDGWSITGNHIHDNNNIGIDAIGYEPTLPAKYRYTDRNRARNGLIADNTVRDIVSKGNPSYWEDGSWCNCADGIYVDGGTKITIRHNTVRDNDIGIEVAAENPRGSADHVLVERNTITGSGYVGLATGGYCNGSEACGGVKTGRSHDNRFTHNTLRGNNRFDDGSPEVLVQYYAYRNSFDHNTVWATDAAHAVIGTVPGAGRDGLSTRLRSDHNTFWAGPGTRATATFGSLGRTVTGFDRYRAVTGLDRHSRFAHP